MPTTINFFGISLSLYYLFWCMAIPVAFIIYHFFRRQFGYSALKSIFYLMGDLSFGFLIGASGILGKGQIYVRVIPFMPVAILVLSRIMKDNYYKVMDFLAPSIAIWHGMMKWGCIFEGCCHGYPSQWGIYSNEVGYVCFPIQPIEAVTSLSIAAILMYMVVKGKQRGKIYAWLAILFGGTRFFLEFLRDNNKIWLGISEYAFFALASLVTGILLLFVLKDGDWSKESEQKSSHVVPLSVLTLAGCCVIFSLLMIGVSNTIALIIATAIVIVLILILLAVIFKSSKSKE